MRSTSAQTPAPKNAAMMAAIEAKTALPELTANSFPNCKSLRSSASGTPLNACATMDRVRTCRIGMSFGFS